MTGAGGSIEKEICRQIINLEPKSLTLIEINEYSLYILEQKYLKCLPDSHIKVFYKLGNASNYKFIKKVFTKYNINVVYHAAAYKHVPL